MNSSSSLSSNAVPDLDESFLQNSAYVGLSLQNILYGVELVLYVKTVGILLKNRGRLRMLDIFWAIFTSIMLVFITIWVATSALFCQKLWLGDSSFPGGPDAYWVKNISVWYLDWGTTAVILLQLMTDGLMIYRCWMIWNTCYPIFVPVILWLATLVLGVVVDWSSSSPGGDFFTGKTAQLALAYYAVSVFLNTLLTCMICYRILQYGRRVQEQRGQEHASAFFSVVPIVIESVLPYTLSGIAFLVSLGLASPTSAAFINIYFLLMCISPQMVIVRVLAGRAWNRDMSRRLELGSDSGSNSLSGSHRAGSVARVHLTTLSKVILPDGHDKVVPPLV